MEYYRGFIVTVHFTENTYITSEFGFYSISKYPNILITLLCQSLLLHRSTIKKVHFNRATGLRVLCFDKYVRELDFHIIVMQYVLKYYIIKHPIY